MIFWYSQEEGIWADFLDAQTPTETDMGEADYWLGTLDDCPFLPQPDLRGIRRGGDSGRSMG